MFKRKKLTVILCVLGALIGSLVFFIRSQYVLPILMYHSVNLAPRPENRCEISLESFRRQMHFLKRHNYHVIALEEAADLISKKKRIPAKTVVLTFDDGYLDNYTYVFPVLKEYNFPATFFVVVNEVSRPQGDRLSWEQITLMQASGLVTIGSHCLGPEPLVNLRSGSALRAEIFDSKKILEQKLGRPVNSFSYPEGRFNAKIRGLVIQAGYKLAVATNPGIKFPNDDIFALKRLRISSTSDSLFVFWVESSGFYNFMREHRRK